MYHQREEDKCHFVSTRGILQSCNIHSPSPTSSNDWDTSYLFNAVNDTFEDGMSIYVCTDALNFFVKQVLPRITSFFVLVTGDSDLNPREVLSTNQIEELIHHPLLLKWFGQNSTQPSHKKWIQLPIGLNYHTIERNPTHVWASPGEGHLPIQQELQLMSIAKNSRPLLERKRKIYANFSMLNDRFNDRKMALAKINENLLEKQLDFLPRTQTWQQMAEHAFILSPLGFGMDTHRTWEALCLGCIPILRVPSFHPMLEDLPVLIVEFWEEVTEDLLENTLQMYSNQEFHLEKLTLDYWVRRIQRGC